jgi:hypothetical protein
VGSSEYVYSDEGDDGRVDSSERSIYGTEHMAKSVGFSGPKGKRIHYGGEQKRIEKKKERITTTKQ